ncbi:MAG: hypothetical protein JSW39_18850 [Desulfobacterales bacterium]|nr:MAG: hypothetical protein JSW39_18850 [Desulfobacterales bacterium]
MKKLNARSKGDRRFEKDRRKFTYTHYIPERRSGHDRRSGKNRRKTPRVKGTA